MNHLLGWALGVSALLTIGAGCAAHADATDDPQEEAAIGTDESSITSWYCGSQCNGKPPSWVVPSNGVQCSASAVRVAYGYPNSATARSWGWSPQFDDPYMKVYVYYSTTCQTMWATVVNGAAIGRYSCRVDIGSYAGPTSYSHGCPAAGQSYTTVMIDDHSPTNGIIAWMDVFEQRYTANGPYAVYTFSY